MLYISDFGPVLRYCKYNFYADDLQIYTHCIPGDLIDTIQRVNEDIIAICDWTTANNLVLNSDKTQAIVLGTSRYINGINMEALPKIRVDRATIPYPPSVKYLGVTVSRCLSWEKQVTNVIYEKDIFSFVSAETLRASTSCGVKI